MKAATTTFNYRYPCALCDHGVPAQGARPYRYEGILPGDLIIVRKQETAQTGQTVVALVNGEATVKTYMKKPGHIELHPANAAMQPIIVQAADEFQIEGVLIGFIRNCAI